MKKSRTIYLRASLSGKDKYGQFYKQIAKIFTSLGYTVWDDVNQFELDYFSDKESNYIKKHFVQTQKKIRNCDIFVAEASKPSSAVGYEIGYAMAFDKPVLVLRHDDFADKKMGVPFVGNPSKLMNILSYNDKNLSDKIKRFERRAQKGIFIKRIPIEFTKDQVDYIEYIQNLRYKISFNAAVRKIVDVAAEENDTYREFKEEVESIVQ
jgi:hypothetical protein